LPFCTTRLTRAFKVAGYPNALNTLGDHLQKRRLDLGIQWKELAARVGATPATVTNWKEGRTAPSTGHWPAILEFLGSDPRPNREGVGRRVKRKREALGLSQGELAERLGVSASVVWRWESGHRKPQGTYLAKATAWLGEVRSPLPVTIGDRLKRHRESRGLTLAAMAGLLRVAESTLCRWENGEREPRRELLYRVQQALHEPIMGGSRTTLSDG
jgi:transcriptional regulator with XRE-family HTH domain